jgi:16S rRNA (adenine1518-N6/adenine1519-N6)-dimethyltransferase
VARVAAVNALGIRARLARRRLALRRDLGQNFLVDPRVAERIARAARIEPGDAVLEIGTGLGLLTEALAARAARVITLEIDAGLVDTLREERALPEHVELLHADALRIDLRALARRAGPRVQVVANLPYSVSSPLLRRLLELRDVLVAWTVMLQREVAERLLAQPGCKAYGSLGVLHRLTSEVARLFELSPGCFHPAPAVVSTLLRITPRPEPELASGELALVERVVRAAFGQRRKTLLNALRGASLPGAAPDEVRAILTGLGIDPRARAESLPPAAFVSLARALAREDD